MTIFLNNLVFNVCHGLYPEEARVAGRFIVNIEISYSSGNHIVREIDETIDYELVFRLVERRMHQPEALLETLAMEIAYNILDSFPRIEHVKVKIGKCNPPIEGMEGSVAVAFNTGRT